MENHLVGIYVPLTTEGRNRGARLAFTHGAWLALSLHSYPFHPHFGRDSPAWVWRSHGGGVSTALEGISKLGIKQPWRG